MRWRDIEVEVEENVIRTDNLGCAAPCPYISKRICLRANEENSVPRRLSRSTPRLPARSTKDIALAKQRYADLMKGKK
jgi:hypothetical protein